MQNHLIPVSSLTVGSELTQTVNARELHSFLEVGKDFSSWIKVQIDRARLVENRDFIVFTQKGENPTGGRPSSEYHLTIESGKHVAMMSGTDKGFEVRDYFIECERIAKKNAPSSFAEALRLAYEQQLRIEEQQKQIAMDQPKVAFYDAVTDSTDAIDMGQAAKVLNVKGVGRNNLFQALRTVGMLDRKNIPMQEYVDRGYFRVIESSWSKPDGSQHINLKTIVYQKGLDYIRQVVNKNVHDGLIANPDKWRLPGSPSPRRRSGHRRKRASVAAAA